MPWKNGYTISDETSMADSAIRWPDGARCCVSVVVNMSLASSPDGISPADLGSGDAYFAMHEGLDAVLRALDRHAFKATFAVPAAMAAVFPAQVREIAAAGHEIAAQGLAHEDVSRLARLEERSRLARTTETLADLAGKPPAGWFSLPRPGDPFAAGTVSEATMDLLLEAGYLYMGNSLADDLPHYWVTDFASRRAMLALPYYYHFDDQFFMLFPSRGSGLENPDFLVRNWRAEFQAQYRRGRFFQMTIQPKNSGWGHRSRMLDDFLGLMRQSPGLWSATSEQCARYWTQAFSAESSLHLEPGIWQDHEGSLS